jgi:hypothetical protein
LQAFCRTVIDGQPSASLTQELGRTATAIRQAESRVSRRLNEKVGDLIHSFSFFPSHPAQYLSQDQNLPIFGRPGHTEVPLLAPRPGQFFCDLLSRSGSVLRIESWNECRRCSAVAYVVCARVPSRTERTHTMSFPDVEIPASEPQNTTGRPIRRIFCTFVGANTRT